MTIHNDSEVKKNSLNEAISPTKAVPHNDSILDAIVQSVTENEMGLMVVDASHEAYELIGKLADGLTCYDKVSIFGCDTNISVHIFPVLYGTPQTDISETLVRCRYSAIHSIFSRWRLLGHNKNRAKSPFSSKRFKLLLDELNYYDTVDYLILTESDVARDLSRRWRTEN